MNRETKERWFELCQQAAVEQNPGQLLALVREINDLLEAKEARLKKQREREDADETASWY